LTGQASTLALTIADDGKGFEVDGVLQQGLGLINMHERVESVGGALEIHATVAGTRLTVTVPTHVAEPALAEMPSV
jgi:signal transduction histidine kinase